MQWKHNLFEVPRGKVGTLFVRELSHLIDAYSGATAMEGIALKASMVLPALVLQKPSPKSKNKDRSLQLEERLTRWAEGDVESLLHEGQTIQSRILWKRMEVTDLARSAEKLVSRGNVRAATRLISEEADKGSLPLNKIEPDGRSVRDHLIDKHPTGTSVDPSTISRSPANELHHIDFDQIDGPMVWSTIHGMSRSAGPSGLDARGWKRLCSKGIQ